MAEEFDRKVMPDLLHKFMRPNELFGRPDPDVLVRIAAHHQFR